ncbi:hypothetical protein G6011_08673 [Alternaria panax]|uniref:Uncharacterized protein n=1 Tax=Alternaria panax TaxID=48097 RepID=A0AAD4FIH8_9PLEO|nr:hypothetical protein G6011_08673 [Alternaria panax]
MAKTTNPQESANDTPVSTATGREQETRGESDTTSGMQTQSQSPLFQSAREIRNQIYYYALDMGMWRTSPTVPPPFGLQHAKLQDQFNKDVLSMNLLLDCKRTYQEAGSLLTETTPVIVPLHTLQRLHTTSKHALNSFLRVAISYPFENERKRRKGINSRRVTNEQYGCALLKALDLSMRALPRLCENREACRTVIVDYGHYWPTRQQFVRSIMKMAKDKFIKWLAGITYTCNETGRVAELEELENIVWAGNECAKGGEHIALVVRIFSPGVTERALSLIEEVLNLQWMEQRLYEDSDMACAFWPCLTLGL